jgi:hypothetical protein
MESMELNVSMTEALTVARTSMSASVLMIGGSNGSSDPRPEMTVRLDEQKNPAGRDRRPRQNRSCSGSTGIYYVLW